VNKYGHDLLIMSKPKIVEMGLGQFRRRPKEGRKERNL
jgi:hypothetical protein